MKKIILILALALGVKVNAQIVGGYLPVNSSKSFTAGNATFSNVIARGTLSVGSTATVTGALNTSSINMNGRLVSDNNFTTTSNAKFGNFEIQSYAVNNGWLTDNAYYNGGFIYRNNGYAVNSYFSSGDYFVQTAPSGVAGNPATMTTRLMVKNTGAVGIGTTAPTATLDVVGNAKVSSTFSLGSANLTGGNTGTVAVLSDAVFAYNFQVASAVNPNDATSYYFSNLNSPTWLSSASANSILMPYNATLIGYHINYIVNGVTGTAETATLQISASGSATNLVTTLDFQGASNSYTSNALSLPVVAGTLMSAVLITPTWVTNPTNIRMGITFLFVRRS